MTVRTPSYGDIDIREEVRRSTEASGVPYHVEDAETLALLARLFSAPTTKPRRGNDGATRTPEGDDQ